MKAEECNAELISVIDKGKIDFSVVRKLIRLCRDRNVAIWHGHDYKTNVLGLIVRRFHRMKLISTVHGWVNHDTLTPAYYWLDRQALKYYDEVICVSKDLLETCHSSGVREERCHLIHNAIDTEQFQRRSDSSTAKKAIGMETAPFLIGAVGRLAPEKGFSHLISACEQLMEEGLNIHLMIAGEGPLHEELRNQIISTKYAERLHLLGQCQNVIPIFEAMDLFVLSSLREGLPNVVLEAMAMQVPVVATEIAGVPSLITHGTHGCLVPPDDIEQLAVGMRQVILSQSLQDRYRLAARLRIEQEYSFENRMQKIATLYEQVLER